MARQQLTGWWKIIDDWFFHGAEQKTIASENTAEQIEFIENYDGAIQTYTNDHSYVGTCDCGCGKTVACNFAELPDGSIISEGCAEQLLERRGQKDLSPWDWRKKRPIRLG